MHGGRLCPANGGFAMKKGHLQMHTFVQCFHICHLPHTSRSDQFLYIAHFHNFCPVEDNSRHLALVPYLARVYSAAKSG
jgi:hypothetical protein